MKYYEDPILGKGRAADISGSTGGGTEYIGGFAIGISGDTISRLRYMPIESVTGNSVTLQAGHAYKAYATSTAITLNTETVPANEFGLEGHIEIYVAGTGYVVTGTNVVLANALEPDSVNNCTLRFHDGVCIISVEDHVAGYIVVNGSTSGEGSLYYGISTSTNDYVAFDASLNGTTIPLAGAVAEGEKHIVGNGYVETTLTGAVDCGASKFTVANLGLQNVQVTGGTMTLGDAFIPSGSTVAVSGGGLAVEKVTGDGGVIDLGGTNVARGYYSTAIASGVTLVGGSAVSSGGGIFGEVELTDCTFTSCYAPRGAAVYGRGSMVDCVITGCTVPASDGYGVVTMDYGNVLHMSGCSIFDNINTNTRAIAVMGGTIALDGGNYINGGIQARFSGARITFAGSNRIANTRIYYGAASAGTQAIDISAGAIVDLTGVTDNPAVEVAGTITFGDNVTVINSAGESVLLNGGEAGTCQKINKDGTIE